METFLIASSDCSSGEIGLEIFSQIVAERKFGAALRKFGEQVCRG
jgi:hypothetical protein